MPGVYLSFPFCAQKCSFCNFASGAFSRDLEHRYYDVLWREIVAHDWAWTPDTVYIGGGTPSNMDLAQLERILHAIPGGPGLGSVAWKEATLEAAPGTITLEKARAWRNMGIDRVSLGVQSFSQAELQRTGRRHTADIVARDCDTLRHAGIDNLNLDLIAGLPRQTVDSWRESLAWISRLRPPHVSVYMFEIDEDSRLGLEVLNNGSRYDAKTVPSDDLAAEFYEMAVDELAASNIHRYEISNFAEPGRESLHNLKYWSMQPYVGFGLDAHGFDGRIRTANTDSLPDYLDGRPAERTEAHPEQERIFTGLRLTEGIELSSTEWQRHRAALERFIEAGLLERCEATTVRLTRRGVLLSNEVFQEFVAA